MRGHTLEKVILISLYCSSLCILIIGNLLTHYPENQFASLAQSFLHGHLYLGINNGKWLDASYYHGYAFWPEGAFPTIVLMPFIALFGNAVYQGYIEFILNLLNLFLLYKIALKITNNKTTSLWLSFSYLFATAYIAVGSIPWSWWFAQVVGTSAILLSIYEYLYKKRWLAIGFYVSCAIATRVDLIFAAIFFISSIIFSKNPNIKKIQYVNLFFIPILFTLFFILLYNYLRFGSAFEFGYSYHIPELIAARGLLQKYGTWNFSYYPTNFYYLFLKGLDPVTITDTGYLTYPFFIPNIWGMSIIITSPIFLWCFNNIKQTIKKKEVQFACISILLIFLFVLGYFGIGTRQYGYRYALDFTPFVFIILCYSFSQNMSRAAKAVIAISFIINAYFFPYILRIPLH